METKTEHQQSSAKLKELVSVGDVCMFTTLDHEHVVTSRPMTTAGIDEEGNLWLGTSNGLYRFRDPSF